MPPENCPSWHAAPDPAGFSPSRIYAKIEEDACFAEPCRMNSDCGKYGGRSARGKSAFSHKTREGKAREAGFLNDLPILREILCSVDTTCRPVRDAEATGDRALPTGKHAGRFGVTRTISVPLVAVPLFLLLLSCSTEGLFRPQPAQAQEGAVSPAGNGSQADVPPDASGVQAGSRQASSFWQIVRASGVIGLVILALSVAGLALVIEHALTIRRPMLMPPAVVDEIKSALAAGQLGRLGQSPQLASCVLGRVVASGIEELEFGWASAEKAMEEALTEESARLYRKVEYLSVIGNLAPMLGLLGTVVGMIVAFREVAETQGAARAADLAQGIYLALVTTVEGLLVAIPALAAFAFFRNKVDALTAEVALTAEKLLAPVRRQLTVAATVPPRAIPGSARTSRGS